MGSANSKVTNKINVYTNTHYTFGYYYFEFTSKHCVATEFRRPRDTDGIMGYVSINLKAKQNVQTKILNGLLDCHIRERQDKLEGKCRIGWYTKLPKNSEQLVINLIKLFNSSFCDTDENILLICKIMETDSLNNERTQDLLKGTTQKMSKDQMVDYLTNELGYNNIGSNIDALFN